MTISASDPAADSKELDRALVLYRDLSVVLRGQVDHLKAETGPTRAEQAFLAHVRALRSVFDAEASLVKRSGPGAAGSELDLDSARAEILARLALRVAEG